MTNVECRMTKEIRRPKVRKRTHAVWHFDFRHLVFLRHSTFVIRIFVHVVVPLFCVAILVGCSTETKHKWLTFFFDGVPSPGASTNASGVVYDENGRPLDRTVVVHTNAPAPKPFFDAHPPY